MTKYHIGVFGSAADMTPEQSQRATELGTVLGQYASQVVIITGGCSGLPYAVASTAAKHGVEVWGYSPMCSAEQQMLKYPNDDITIYKKLFYVPDNYHELLLVPQDFDQKNDHALRAHFRNVRSVTNCHAGIIISGRWGSLNEFTILYDMGKLIGVLTGTGGAADELPSLTQKISKSTGAKVLFNNSANELVKEILRDRELRNTGNADF